MDLRRSGTVTRASWAAGLALLALAAIAAACGSSSDSPVSSSAEVSSTPPAFGTLLLWLDANAGVTQTNGFVSQWEDQSGNNNNVSQNTLASQPTYHASGAGPAGGLPYLSFGNTASNYFSTDVFLDNTLSNLTANGDDVTVLVAARLPYGGAGGTLFTLRRTGPIASFSYVSTFGSDYAYSDGVNGSSNDLFDTAPLPVTGSIVLDYTYHQGTSVVLTVDGKTVNNSGSATSYTGNTGFTVGTREDVTYQPWEGDIYEVLVYQGVLSKTNLAAAREYLATEWGVELSSSGALNAGKCPTGLTLCADTCVPWQDGAPCTAPAGPSSWTKAHWYIDPANSTGAASDSNACTSTTAPCLTYGHIESLWGTYSPQLAQNTTITFLSSQPDDTDPVYFSPLIENATMVTIEGALGPAQQVATGTLSNVVPKSQAAGQLWQATLPAGVSPGQLVVNTTRTSRAWVYKSAGGDSWLLSQPMASSNLASVFPGETDNWANGDTVVVYQPVTVDLAQVTPIVAGGNVPYFSYSNFSLNVYQLTVADGSVDAAAPAQDDFQVGTKVNLVESSVRKTVSVQGGASEYDVEFGNDDFTQSIATTTGPIAVDFWGGQTRYGGGQTMSLNGGELAGDIVLSGECDVYQGGDIDSAFIDTGSALVLRSGLVSAYQWGSPLNFWGPGSMDVVGNTRLEYPPNATASSIFLEAGGLFLNVDPSLIEGSAVPGSSTACAVDASGDWTCGIAVTPANLDTAISAGGFGGLAVVPAGASITDIGTVDGTE